MPQVRHVSRRLQLATWPMAAVLTYLAYGCRASSIWPLAAVLTYLAYGCRASTMDVADGCRAHLY